MREPRSFPHHQKKGQPSWSSTSPSRSPRVIATSTRSTTRRDASGSTGCSSPRRATPPTTATSRTPSARTATRSTRSSCSRSPPSPAASSGPRPIGMFHMTRRGRRRRQDPLRPGRRPARRPTSPSWTTISEFDRLEIQHFFETYKDLEPGKSVEGAHWAAGTRPRRNHRGPAPGRGRRHDHGTLDAGEPRRGGQAPGGAHGGRRRSRPAPARRRSWRPRRSRSTTSEPPPAGVGPLQRRPRAVGAQRRQRTLPP